MFQLGVIIVDLIHAAYATYAAAEAPLLLVDEPSPNHCAGMRDADFTHLLVSSSLTLRTSPSVPLHASRTTGIHPGASASRLGADQVQVMSSHACGVALQRLLSKSLHDVSVSADSPRRHQKVTYELWSSTVCFGGLLLLC